MTVEALNSLVGIGTLALHLLLVLMLGLYVMREETTQELVGTWALPVAFLAAFVGSAMTLVYSEYFGVIPCGLCWFQRVFLYPQIILFAIAQWKHDATVVFYSIAMSVFGMIVSLYQHYLQMGGTSALPCPASGEADCGKRIIFEFGYITFPLAAFSLFAFITILMLFYYRHTQRVRS
ncbi:MAG: disulfide bond formation protein B [Candidatus Pacebacteria bacterium]|nr:disulfide bond formation protein B [Candidatus Paceibacterota bacterium]